MLGTNKGAYREMAEAAAAEAPLRYVLRRAAPHRHVQRGQLAAALRPARDTAGRAQGAIAHGAVDPDATEQCALGKTLKWLMKVNAHLARGIGLGAPSVEDLLFHFYVLKERSVRLLRTSGLLRIQIVLCEYFFARGISLVLDDVVPKSSETTGRGRAASFSSSSLPGNSRCGEVQEIEPRKCHGDVRKWYSCLVATAHGQC
eukprot:Skav210018  [mRNA]  locus=scaffold1212:202264:204829:- [translate_table: standard]